MRTLLITCLLVAFLPFNVSAAQGPDYAEVRHKLQALIEEELDSRDDLRGVSIALVDDQRIVWARGFGHADKESKLGASERTVYRAGGLTALFTAAAVMRLAEEGKLDLDKPLRHYLPDFHIQSRFKTAGPITPRNLLTHRSGLPLAVLKDMWTKQPASLARHVADLSAVHMAHAPDTVYSYSVMGYTVLGRLIEAVSGEAYEDYIGKHIIQPLGMARTGFVVTDAMQPWLATGYRDKKPRAQYAARDVSAVGLYSNATDLARFMQMMFAEGKSGDRQFLSPESVAEMFREQNADNPLDLDNRVGLGWRLTRFDHPEAGEVAWQQGSTPLFRARMLVSPRHKVGVVVMANAAGAYRTLEAAADEALASMLEVKTGVKRDGGGEAVLAPVDGEETASLAGDFSSMLGLIPIRRDGERYQAEVLGWHVRLEPVGGGWYKPRYKLFGLIPIPFEALNEITIKGFRVAGHEVLVARYKGSRYLLGQRLSPAPVPKAWRNRVGSYRVEAPDHMVELFDVKDGRLEYQDGRLMFSYRLPTFFPVTLQVPLQPLDDSVAVIPGLGTILGEAITARTIDGEDHLVYSGYVLRRLD